MARLRSLAGRLPVRVRVTLAFSVAMALVLAATGLFLYVRLRGELDATLDQGLRSRAGDVTALIGQADSGLAEAGRSPLTEQGESVAQIVTRRGQVVDAAPPFRQRSLLNPSQLRRGARSTLLADRPPSGAVEDRLRLLATPVHAQGRDLLVVVGSSLGPRDAALRNLGGLLLLGGPAALLLVSLAGYLSAALALRPVELMRRRAQEIQAGSPGRRLPLPAARDEVARLGETLNAMLERLERAFERERTFVSDASHELRMPLAILKSELELAVRDATTAEQFRAAVTSAGFEVDRLARLADDLLVIARAEDGRVPLRREQLDVGEVLSALRRRFARHAATRGSTLTTRAAEGLRLNADRVRLDQALGNLVANALRHGGPHVECFAVAADTGVELHVRDDGGGFPADFLDRAFVRFARGDEARGRGGTGLGLAIVELVAEAHGGTVGAANRAGGGADVWLTLPRAPARAP